MNVVSVTLDYAESNGGSATAVRQFAEALGGATISFTSAALMRDAVRAPGVLHVEVSGPGALYGRPAPRGLLAAEELLRDADFVFCHKLFRYHNDWVRRVAGRRGIPYCVVPHGALDPYVFTYRALRKRAWLASLGRRLFARSAGLLFATRREQEKARPFSGEARSWVVNWPVPYLPVADPAGARRRVRRQLGIPDGDRVLLFLGRLDPMKRPQETIDAFARTAAAGSHLILAGPDGACSAEALAAHARGAGNVRVIEPVYGAAKWELYHAADAFVNLSARENFGYTVAEALAAGLPVVLSPGNDLAAELDPVRCAWVAGEDRAAAFAAAMAEALHAPAATLRAMAERGRAWALAHTSLDRFRARLLALIEEASCDC
jgi:glycosyltransferase involved in cell wall biosynthesis